MYSDVLKGSVTLKFHNLTHYPTIIRAIGPLYHCWTMRCEGKHREMKRMAASSGNYKNLCKTLAVRSQLKQTERLMARRGIEQDVSCVRRCVNMTLSHLVDGEEVSAMLGNYGIYRDICRVEKIVINGITYCTNSVLIADGSDLFPEFVVIDRIFVMDTREVAFFCHALMCCAQSHHYQAYEVTKTDKTHVILDKCIKTLPSPWPLVLRSKQDCFFVSLKHEI